MSDLLNARLEKMNNVYLNNEVKNQRSNYQPKVDLTQEPDTVELSTKDNKTNKKKVAKYVAIGLAVAATIATIFAGIRGKNIIQGAGIDKNKVAKFGKEFKSEQQTKLINALGDDLQPGEQASLFKQIKLGFKNFFGGKDNEVGKAIKAMKNDMNADDNFKDIANNVLDNLKTKEELEELAKNNSRNNSENKGIIGTIISKGEEIVTSESVRKATGTAKEVAQGAIDKGKKVAQGAIDKGRAIMNSDQSHEIIRKTQDMASKAETAVSGVANKAIDEGKKIVTSESVQKATGTAKKVAQGAIGKGKEVAQGVDSGIKNITSKIFKKH